MHWRLPRWFSGKESACQYRRHKGCWFNPWVGKIPWSRKWQPTSVVLPGKFHGQRSLEGYSSWCCKELDMTEWLSTDSTAMTTMLDSTGLGRVGRTWRAQEEKKKKSKVINISSSCLRTVICCYVILSHTTQRMLWQLPKTYTTSNQFLWKLNNLCSELNAVSGTQPTLNKCWLLLVAF